VAPAAPEVLAEFVMEPIGASRTWQWVGYDNAWVLVDGRAVQSVPGAGTGAAGCSSRPATSRASAC
jgi:hypothetical protein